MSSPASNTPKSARNPLAAIRSRLEKFELEHLRVLVCEQADTIERLRDQLAFADCEAVTWRDDCFRLMNQASPPGSCIGLSIDGALHFVPSTAEASKV